MKNAGKICKCTDNLIITDSDNSRTSNEQLQIKSYGERIPTINITPTRIKNEVQIQDTVKHVVFDLPFIDEIIVPGKKNCIAVHAIAKDSNSVCDHMNLP